MTILLRIEKWKQFNNLWTYKNIKCRLSDEWRTKKHQGVALLRIILMSEFRVTGPPDKEALVQKEKRLQKEERPLKQRLVLVLSSVSSEWFARHVEASCPLLSGIPGLQGGVRQSHVSTKLWGLSDRRSPGRRHQVFTAVAATAER